MGIRNFAPPRSLKKFGKSHLNKVSRITEKKCTDVFIIVVIKKYKK
jgi:hypothetical protein